MKYRTILLSVTLCACGEQAERPLQWRHAPSLPAPELPEPPEPEPPSRTGLYNKPKVEQSPAELGRQMFQLGRDQYIAEEQLAGAFAAVIFLQCLERLTGGKVDGKIMERHIRRNTLESRTCKKEYGSMTKDQIATQAMAWTEQQRLNKESKTL